MAENPLSDGTQALLDEFARRRGLSKRAMAELRKSLAEGSNQWVEALSTGTASQRQPRASPGKLKVPRPTAGIAPACQAPQPCRRRQQFIAKQTNNYERDQYHRSQSIKDAGAQRIEDQLIFEYGKQGLEEMRRLQAENSLHLGGPGAEHTVAEDDPQAVRDTLVEQIFNEIEERIQFQQDMQGVRGAKESCRAVRLEVAQRVSELARLGVDVSAARREVPTGLKPTG